MSLTITLPQALENRLKQKAHIHQLSVEDLAIELLWDVLETDERLYEPLVLATTEDDFLTLEEVMAKIKATPPDLSSIRPAQGSLAEALRKRKIDPNFDIAAWNQAWADVEIEIKAITRANDIREGRGG